VLYCHVQFNSLHVSASNQAFIRVKINKMMMMTSLPLGIHRSELSPDLYQLGHLVFTVQRSGSNIRPHVHKVQACVCSSLLTGWGLHFCQEFSSFPKASILWFIADLRLQILDPPVNRCSHDGPITGDDGLSFWYPRLKNGFLPFSSWQRPAVLAQTVPVGARQTRIHF
jgi:hypothetical protein